LAGTTVFVEELDGSRAEYSVMRGNDQQLTVFDKSPGERIQCRVNFPSGGPVEKIWDISARRGIEFLSLFDNRMVIFAGGGATNLKEVSLAANQALALRSGITHIVLLAGTEGATDEVVNRLDELLPDARSEEAQQFVKIHVIDIAQGPDEMIELLRSTGR
jgi:hypothetical protein